jgi:hypothetical protein
MFRVATPPETDTVPIVVRPSLKVTLPDGVRLPTSKGEVCSVAVRTTCCPKAGVVVLALRSVEVAIFVPASDTVPDLLAMKFVSPG